MKRKMKKKMIAFLLCMVLVICNSVSILADTPAAETTTTEKQAKETGAAKSEGVSEDEKSADNSKDMSKTSEETEETKEEAPETKTTKKKEETTEATTQKKEESTTATTTEKKEETEESSETSETKETEEAEETATTGSEEGTSDKKDVEEEKNTETKDEENAVTELTYEDDDVIVTVSEVAEGAIPEGAELKVVPILKDDTETQAQYTEVEQKIHEKAAETETEIKGFLAYDITFMDENGNEVEPNSEVKVSMEYKQAAIPAGLSTEDAKNAEVSVLHLEEDADGNVAKVVDMGEAGKVDALETTEEQQVAKIEFQTNSFSVYAVEWAQDATTRLQQPAIYDSGTYDEPQGSILTDELLKNNNESEGTNYWQIVDQKYAGNDHDNKTLSEDGNVSVQKNVIATDVENEFLVYLSVDVKQVYEEFFKIATYYALTYNSEHGTALGEYVEPGGSEVPLSHESGNNTCKVDIYYGEKLDDSVLIAEDVSLYWDKSNNITVLLPLDNGEFVVVGTDIKDGREDRLLITPETLEKVENQILDAVNLKYVEDTMGDYIDYIDVVAVNGSVDDSTEGKIVWNLDLKENPISESITEDDGEGDWQEHKITTTWSYNVAELIYRVRLNVTKDGFDSCANNMDSDVNEDETYPVNTNATLYYGDNETVDFPIPHVRGLLYDIEFTKHDENGTSLSGAEFTISGTYCGEDIERKAISQADGSVKIKNIPWGTYTLTETESPEGYQDDETPIENNIILCYTEHSELLGNNHIGLHQSDAEDDISRLLYNQNISDDNIVVNKKVTTSVSVHKEWNLPGENYGHPDKVTVELLAKVDGADFELPDNIATEVDLNDTNNWTYTFNNLPMKNADGDKIIYTVIETKIGLFPVEDSSYESKVTGNQEDGFIITNTWIDFWYLYKVSDTDETIGLPGAQFILTETDTEKVYYGKSYQNGFVAWFESKEDADKDIVEKILRYIPDGEYVLEETEAPQGYQKSDIQWTITIENLQLISIVDSNGQTVGTYNPSSRAAIKEYHFVNEPLYELPSAGGPGIYWYTLSGTLLMAGAALIVYRQKRKREVLLRK